MTTTNLASIVAGVAVVVLLIVRQMRACPASADLRLPLILGIIGVIEVSGYFQKGHPGAGPVAGLVLSLILAAVLGGARAVTMRLWKQDGQAWRQGTWVTAALWLITVGIHFGVDELLGQHASGSLAGSSILLYLAVTYTVQRLIILYRAQRLPLPGPADPAAAMSPGDGPDA